MNVLIETAVGLALLYFLASLLVGAIVESISAMFKMRARVLRDALVTMLGDATLIFDHPLIKPMQPHRAKSTWLDTVSRVFQRKVPQPSYIHPRLMAQALLSPVLSSEMHSDTVKILVAIHNLPTVQAAPNLRDAKQKELERWFDEAMKRWSGVYSRQSQAVSILVCVILVPALNIDTVAVARLLWNSPELRMSLASQASEVIVDQNASAQSGVSASSVLETPPLTVDPVVVAKKALDDLKMPLGWPSDLTWSQLPSALIGWLISIIAISAGSKFWFGVLNRVTNMRLTGTPPLSTN